MAQGRHEPSDGRTRRPVDLLQSEGVKVTATQASPWTGVLGWIFPLLLFAALWVFLLRRASGAAGAALGLGRARTKIVDRREMKTTFADAAGVDEAVEELREIVDEEITAILTDAHERAGTILVRDRHLLDELAALLLEHEVIEGADLSQLVAQRDAQRDRGSPAFLPGRPLRDER